MLKNGQMEDVMSLWKSVGKKSVCSSF